MYPFAWTPGSQKVIILMTDEIAQTIVGNNVAQVNAHATDQGFEIFVFALQEHHPNGFVRFLCSFCVQANNVIKVGISSDRRYGPVMNYELALKIARRLEQLHFHPSRASRVILVGYSGGA